MSSQSGNEAFPSKQNTWKKRTLSIGFILALVGGIAWATTPKASLSKRIQDVPISVDDSIAFVVQQVDDEINRNLIEHQLRAANRAEWNIIARRIGLALIGNGLSLEEQRVVEQLPEEHRIDWWTEYLFRDRRTWDYLAERFTRATVGTNQGPFLLFRRRKYVHWFADQLEANVPYDVLVRKLICSEGSWTDAPEVNFLTATMDDADRKKPDAVRLAGRTSRAFLAQRIDCLQCHQDYLGKVGFTDDLSLRDASNEHDEERASLRQGEQADFHQLAAFFSGVRMENAFVGLKNQETDYRVKYLHDEQETAVEPMVPYRQDLLPPNGNARQRLAIWITHPENKAFPRATVNRVWAILFGIPLVEPLDHIPLSGNLPRTLEILADDFASHHFDLRRLIRIIIRTQAFQHDSRFESDVDQSVTEDHEKYWAVFPLTQLRPEQVAASIHQASRIKAIDQNSSIISQLELFGGINDFTKAFGDRGDDEFASQSITIPQRLLVMNGNYINERLKHNPVMNAATRIADLTTSDTSAIESAYLSVLNRLPTEKETLAFLSDLEGKRGKARSQALSSVFWTLFNSTEFQWNH